LTALVKVLDHKGEVTFSFECVKPGPPAGKFAPFLAANVGRVNRRAGQSRVRAMSTAAGTQRGAGGFPAPRYF
ncbi:MAG: hypothetical protein RLT05_14970, partial [Bauldia litoralis]